MSRNNRSVEEEDNSTIEYLFQLFYKSSNQLLNSTAINLCVVFLFVYILVRQILGYLEKKDKYKLQELEKRKVLESDDLLKSKNEDFFEKKEEEDDEDEDIFKNPHPTPAAADTDDFVCPFSLMSIKELEKLKVDGLFDKPFRQFKQDGLSPFMPYKKENGFQHPVSVKKPEDEEVKKAIETNTDTQNPSHKIDDPTVNDELEIQKQQMEVIFKLIKQTKTETNGEKCDSIIENGIDSEEDIKGLIESQMKLYGLK